MLLSELKPVTRALRPSPPMGVALDFRLDRYGQEWRWGPLSGLDGWTFARATRAMREDGQGGLVLAEVDEARLAPGDGLTMEGAATNLHLHALTVGGEGWSILGGATVEIGAALAPDGTMSLNRLTGDDVWWSGCQATTAMVLQEGVEYVASLYVRPETPSSIRLAVFDGSDILASAEYYYVGEDNDIGIVLVQGLDAEVIPQAGMLRLTLRFACEAEAAVRVHVQPDVTSAGGSMLVWGAQMEAGRQATSLIPTTTAAATRAPDQAAVLGLETLLANGWTALLEADIVTGTLGWVESADGQNGVGLTRQSDGEVAVCIRRDGDIETETSAPGSAAWTGILRAAVSVDGTGVCAAVCGVSIEAFTLSGVFDPPLDRLKPFQTLAFEAAGSVRGRRFVLLPYAVDDAALEAMTA